MKHEWRKHEKGMYVPKAAPEQIDVPTFAFFSIEGKGNPNDSHFSEYIEVLYSLSYAVRMSYKSGLAPDSYEEYTVYPLEGVWDLNDQAKKKYDGTFNKDDLLFNLMIRQPDFVTSDFAEMMLQITKEKKPHKLLEHVIFQKITEGKCVQMMHVGSYDDEPKSFSLMQSYCDENNLIRKSKRHREIYLSDVRKVAPEKLKTVLRFKV